MFRVFVFVFIYLFFAAEKSYANDFSDLNGKDKNWFYSLWGKSEDRFKGRMEEAVNDFFQEPMYRLIGEGIGEAFGRKFGDTLSGLVSIGPFLSIDSIIGSFGKSEGQVMTKVILRAIEEAKEDIINAVEQQYRDTTSAHLTALVEGVDVYNARSVSERQNLYGHLSDFINSASYIRARMQVKPSNTLEDLHAYMSVSALQVSLQREFTRWAILDNNENATEEYIESEIEAVISVLVSNTSNYITSSLVSDIEYWRNSYKSKFIEERSFVRPAKLHDIIPHGVSNYQVGGSGIYSYRMLDRVVEFKILQDKNYCYVRADDGYSTERRFDVFDAAGSYVGTYRMWRDTSPKDYAAGGCAYRDGELAAIDQKGIFLAAIVNAPRAISPFGGIRQVVDRHRNDLEAFHSYLVDGYLPVKRMIDSWWDMSRSDTRYKSALDYYIEQNIESRPDLNVVLVEDHPQAQGFGEFVFRVSNIGGGHAGVLSVSRQYPGSIVVLKMVDGDTGQVLDIPGCNAHDGSQCSVGNLMEGGELELYVQVSMPYGMLEAELDISVYTPDVEITKKNNTGSVMLSDT